MIERDLWCLLGGGVGVCPLSRRNPKGMGLICLMKVFGDRVASGGGSMHQPGAAWPG